MTVAAPWSVLGIDPTTDSGAVRRAYAARLKLLDIEEDPAAYAALREARELALYLAAAEIGGGAGAETGEAEPSGSPDVPSDQAAPWAYSAPHISNRSEQDASLAIGTPGPLDAEAFARLAHDASPAIEPAGDASLTGYMLHAPLLPGGFEAGSALSLRPGETADGRLAELLMLAAEGQTLEPFDPVEEAEALRCLSAILADAQQSHVSRSEMIEEWLAESLARSWPRSAPLLEAATEAFGWEREWGRLEARPAIEYLGARLRGYRFQQAVLAPDHRYSKAWHELVRPGEAGPFKRFRVRRRDVRGLLEDVRKDFPELEDHFNAQRVLSWERKLEFPKSSIFVCTLVAYGIFHYIDLRSRFGDPEPQLPPPSVQVEARVAEKAESTLTAVVKDAFGQERTSDWLRLREPELAELIAANARRDARADIDASETVKSAVEIVRQRVFLDGRLAKDSLFDETMRLHLAHLKAARAVGTDECEKFMRTARLGSDVAIPESVRRQERRLAEKMADASMLKQPVPTPPASASVPGELVEKVMRATRLGDSQVTQAMAGKGTANNRCAVAIALLESALNYSGKGRREILLAL